MKVHDAKYSLNAIVVYRQTARASKVERSLCGCAISSERSQLGSELISG